MNPRAEYEAGVLIDALKFELTRKASFERMPDGPLKIARLAATDQAIKGIYHHGVSLNGTFESKVALLQTPLKLNL